ASSSSLRRRWARASVARLTGRAASSAWAALAWPARNRASASSSLSSALAGSRAMACCRRLIAASGVFAGGFGGLAFEWLRVAAEDLAQLAFRERAGEAVEYLAVPDLHHRGDALDAEHRRQFLLGIHIDLAQPECAVEFGGQLFQHRPQSLARLA